MVKIMENALNHSIKVDSKQEKKINCLVSSGKIFLFFVLNILMVHCSVSIPTSTVIRFLTVSLSALVFGNHNSASSTIKSVLN